MLGPLCLAGRLGLDLSHIRVRNLGSVHSPFLCSCFGVLSLSFLVKLCENTSKAAESGEKSFAHTWARIAMARVGSLEAHTEGRGLQENRAGRDCGWTPGGIHHRRFLPVSFLYLPLTDMRLDCSFPSLQRSLSVLPCSMLSIPQALAQSPSPIQVTFLVFSTDRACVSCGFGDATWSPWTALPSPSLCDYDALPCTGLPQAQPRVSTRLGASEHSLPEALCSRAAHSAPCTWLRSESITEAEEPSTAPDPSLGSEILPSCHITDEETEAQGSYPAYLRTHSQERWNRVAACLSYT